MYMYYVSKYQSQDYPLRIGLCVNAKSPLTSLPHMPYLQAVPVVNGDQIFPKWQQNLYLTLVAMIRIHLLSPLEGLDDCPACSEHQMALQCQTLEGVGLNLTWGKNKPLPSITSLKMSEG